MWAAPAVPWTRRADRPYEGTRFRWALPIIAVLGATMPQVAAPNTTGVTTLAPGILFYERPGTGAAGAQQAVQTWPRLSPVVMREIRAGLVSGVLFAHLYTAGEPHPVPAEWVFLALTRRDPDHGAAVLLRFAFDDLSRIASYRQELPQGPEIDVREAASLFKQRPLYPDMRRGAGTIEAVDGFFFLVSEPNDFGGTEVLTRNGGVLVFAATSIYDGIGQMLFPPS
jgi:hypothetical protein